MRDAFWENNDTKISRYTNTIKAGSACFCLLTFKVDVDNTFQDFPEQAQS